MSHSGITPLPEDQQGYEILISGGMLLPSGESNFFDFRQHTSSEWDSTTPTGDTYYSPSGDWSTRNLNYLMDRRVVRHKSFLLAEGQLSDSKYSIKYIVASGLNYPFPYPYNKSYPDNVSSEMFSLDWWEASGIYQTYPQNIIVVIDKERQSGIFHWDELRQVEGLSSSIDSPKVPEVTFNNYIHYIPEYPYHKHIPKPENNLTTPDYSFLDKKPFISGDEAKKILRDQQDRKHIEFEFLSDVKKRSKPSEKSISSYSLDADGLFALAPIAAPILRGSCLYPDGSCKDGISEQACLAFPGAIWNSGTTCIDLGA